MLEPFELLLSLGPIGLVLVLFGWINLRRRPLAVSGMRESAVVALATWGLAIIGPMELFFPNEAANEFGAWVWVLLNVLYLLTLLLWLLTARLRLVVYNIAPAQLHAVLAEVALQLDETARWAGDTLALPSLGMQMRVESFSALRNVSVVAGEETGYSAWLRWSALVRTALARVEVPPNPRGYSLLIGGLILLVGVSFQALSNPQQVAQGLFQLLRL